MECAGSLRRANILSDLTGSTKSTITTSGNTYTIINKPFNLSACFQNSGYAGAFNLAQSLYGQARMTVGYDARCIINWALDQNKIQYNNPVNLDIPIIVWQHITSNSPFTIDHDQTGIQASSIGYQQQLLLLKILLQLDLFLVSRHMHQLILHILQALVLKVMLQHKLR